MTTTWRKLISEEMAERADSWDAVVGITLSQEQLDAEFDDNYGRTEGVPFTLWTKTRVYFPMGYDGSEACVSVARYPDGVATEHVGGG